MTTKNNIEVFDEYVATEAEFHTEKVQKCEGDYNLFYSSRYNKWCKRSRDIWFRLDQLGIKIPDEFLKVYSIPFEEFLESKIVMKYQVRGYNCLRELLRTVVLIPELLDPEKQYDILELSSGSCANYEVLEHYNNTVQVTDYLDGRGSAYTPIHKWLDVDVISFNGGELPYKMGDKSYDYLITYQAIDAYGPPRHWPRFVAEMARIARKKIVIILNRHAGGATKREWFYNVLQETYPSVEIGECPDTSHAVYTITV